MDFSKLAEGFGSGFSESFNSSGSGGQQGANNVVPGMKPVIGSISNKLKKKKKQTWTPYQTDRMISPADMSSGEEDDGQ